MSAHTPGPWMPADWATGVIVGSGDRLVATIENMHLAKRRSESQANARLITAAPDMLAALREAAATIHTLSGTDDSMKWVLGQVRAAIAKAEGRPS